MRSNTDTPDGRGNDGFADHLRRERQRSVELQFYNSQTIAFEQTTRGVRAHVKNPQTGSSSIVQGFQLVSDGGDYYNCNYYDGVNVGNAAKVAKDQDLRCILPTASPTAGGAWATKAKRGTTYTYTYAAVAGTTTDGVNVVEYTRSVYLAGVLQTTSYVTPVLNPGDIIYALPCTFAGPATLTSCQWIALASGRAWADPLP